MADGITTHAAVDALLDTAFDAYAEDVDDDRTVTEVIRDTLAGPANRPVVAAWLVDVGFTPADLKAVHRG